MSKLNELNSYLAQVQSRMRLLAWLRGAAVFSGTALVVTLLLVIVLNRFAFPAHGITLARMALLWALACATAFGLALPLRRLTRDKAVHKVEKVNPEMELRLTTFHDAQRKGAGPFVELLAGDALSFTQYAAPSSLIEDSRLFALGGVGAACLGVLLWMVAAGPGYLGYGSSLLWTGARGAQPFYSISVTPGNVTVRRNSDQLITARLNRVQPGKVQLYAKYLSGGGWEPAAMQEQPNATGAATYQFVLAGLPENVEYYVAAGSLVSPHYTVRVVDLPSVKQMRVTYRYPKWTRMKPVVQEHSGDLRAIEGTDADVEFEMDRPLKDGQLTLEDGRSIHLTGGAENHYSGTVHMEKDGAYHVAAVDAGQLVRLSEDYFIATDKAQPPEISIARPQGDYRASPIEEVIVGVRAADEFGLNDVHLHYSVNGAPERVVSLLNVEGAKQVDGSHMLPLEDYKLVPGDLVSLYATARDGHSEARTDISFIQVEPFEREFSQSQQSGGQGGGGGGGQDNQTEISKREKELIAATWKQQNTSGASTKDAAVAGQFLSDAQKKLRDQVMALSARMESRDLSSATEEFTGFDKDMHDAAAAMAPSADKLKATQWKDALPLEQKALQALLRAEATFRKIEVAFGQGGGGGGGGNSGRDLASLFDLELDTEKNQYETAQSISPAQQHEKAVDDALAKLDALAKRQEEQANQQPNSQQSFEQRWQQEMLRREAEELKRQMEELAKSAQSGQTGGTGSSSSTGSKGDAQGQASEVHAGSQQPQNQQTSGGQAGRRSDQRVTEALQRLEQATDAMKRGSGSQRGGDAARQAARQAAQQLRQASQLLAGTQQQLASGKLDSMVQEAGRLAEQERAQAERIDKLANQQSSQQANQQTINHGNGLDGMMARIHERDTLAQERQQLSDDLSKLEKNVRDAAREMAPNQPGAAKNLRDALGELDESDLGNRVQRTADWLRRGINPNSNGTEAQVAQGLEKLNEQLQRAQKAVGQQQPGSGTEGADGDQTAELDALERLRNQIESMQHGRGEGDRRESASATARPGNQRGSNTGHDSQGNSSSQAGQGSEQRQGGSRAQTGGTNQGGADGERGRDIGNASGDMRSVGGPAGGTVWGNINTGNNRYRHPGDPANATSANDNLQELERTYQEGMKELGHLRSAFKSDPQAAKEAEALAKQMQHLDPSRFPGNPAIVEQMRNEMLGSIDRLELQVERDSATATESRTGKPYATPAGYEDSVADYYRQLSKNH